MSELTASSSSSSRSRRGRPRHSRGRRGSFPRDTFAGKGRNHCEDRLGIREDIEDDDDDDDDDGMLDKNSNHRVNVNHLTNFQFAPIENTQRRYKRVVTQAFDKNIYVKAQFRFMLSSGERHLLVAHADDRLNWDEVNLIEYPVETVVSCPICLYEPVAPRLSQCGHCFCLACMIRYLDGSIYKRCPLCFEPVHLNELKPLRFSLSHRVSTGDELHFTLVYRSKSSVAVSRVDTTADSSLTTNNGDLPVCSVFGYSSIIVKNDTRFLLQEDHHRLSDAIGLCDDVIEKNALILALREVESQLISCHQSPTTSKSIESQSIEAASSKLHHHHYHHHHHLHDSASSFIFYQRVGGDRVYLDPLCFQCLKHQANQQQIKGQNDNTATLLPTHLSCTVVDIVYYTQTAATRSMFRFLSHLTLTTSFGIAEIDMEPFVSRKTLKHFAKAFSKRSRQRAKQVARQNKHDQRAATRSHKDELRLRMLPELESPTLSSSLLHQNPCDLNNSSFGPSLSSAQNLPTPAISSSWSTVTEHGFASNSTWQALPSAPMSSRTQTNSSWPCTSTISSSSTSSGSPTTTRGKRVLYSNAVSGRPKN